MYIKEVCEIRGVKEVYKYTPWRSVYKKGEKRAVKTNPTSEAQKKVNERRSKNKKTENNPCQIRERRFMAYVYIYERKKTGVY